MLVPDSSHGTNPATATMAGFRTITIPSAADGGVDLDAFRAALGPRTAAIMITNPSTLGLFERRIGELLEAVHAAGALAYMDGANLNAILGRFKPGEAGFDVMHINTHKTFSTPHGGGGPGAGPVGVGEHLVPFLPAPASCARTTARSASSGRASGRPRSAGCARSSAARGVLVRAYAYTARARRRRACARSPTTPSSPPTTSRRASARRTTSRSTGRASTSSSPRPPSIKQRTGMRTLDIAKRLIDKGFHPPTIYFPLTVEEGMLIEPTETESLETLDALRRRADRDRRGRPTTDPELVTAAPHSAPVRRLDEATAARQPNLRWRPMTGAETPVSRTDRRACDEPSAPLRP